MTIDVRRPVVDLSSAMQLRGHLLRNRMVATAHGSGLIDDGLAGAGDAPYWGRIAEGGVGMVVSGATIVSRESTVRAGNLVAAYRADARAGMERRACAIKAGGAVPISQLIHLGRETLGAESWFAVAAPSSIRSPRAPMPPRTLRADEIPRLINDFRGAAELAVDSGFAGVELHAAHGYLLEQFLARETNQRSDVYGPGPDGGLRLVVAIIEAIRRSAPDVVVGVRLSAIESLMPADDVRWVMARLAEEVDVDYFSIAVGERGQYVKDMNIESPPLLPMVADLARVTEIPLLVSQAFRTAGDINDALALGADLVGLCRTLIADPEAPNKMLTRRTREIRPCTACNEDCRLFDPCLLCSVNPDLAPPGHSRRPANPLLLQLSARPGRDTVAVIGGGPAGLEASLTLAKAGRTVVLYEASEVWGGQLALAASAPHRSGWTRLLRFYSERLADLSVQTHLGATVTAQQVADHADIILAVGAVESLPVPGLAVGAITCSQAIAQGTTGLADVGELVVVDDGFGWWPIVNTVELAVAAGVERITVLVPSGAFAMGIPADARIQLLPRLTASGLEVRPFLLPVSFSEGRLTVRNVLSGGEQVIVADRIVVAGQRIPREWPMPIGPRVQAVGDCVTARKVAHAVSEGRAAAELILAR